MKLSDQQLLLGWVHTSYIMGLGCVGFMIQWAELDWIDENGPTSNSGPMVTKDL